MAKKITIDHLAEMTKKQFDKMASKEDLQEAVAPLATKAEMHQGFDTLRQEIKSGTAQVLAAIETVEYRELRIRIAKVEREVETAKGRN